MKPPISWYWTPTSVADQILRGNTNEYTRRMSLGIKSLCAGQQLRLTEGDQIHHQRTP